MAHPFGGHPTFLQYLQFLRSQGFTYKTGYTMHHGVGYGLIKIFDAKGNPVRVVSDMDLEERLPPDMVSEFDKMFGVKSSFAKSPQE
ncbi:MAG: hypothetical protein ACPG30_05925 [Parvibaculales bacterium]